MQNSLTTMHRLHSRHTESLHRGRSKETSYHKVESSYLQSPVPVHDVVDVLRVEVWQQLVGDVLPRALGVDDGRDVTLYAALLHRLLQTLETLHVELTR